MKRYFLTTLVCLMLIAGVAYGDCVIIHVPGDYPTIQEAIGAAKDCDTVLVADGIWTGPGNKDLDFGGKAITVTSENGPENCIIDCEGTEEEPHRGFYFHSGEGINSVVSGLTITNGYDVSAGGGIICQYSSPTITNCIITDNTAGYESGDGGGIYCSYSSATITNCIISNNVADDFGGGIRCSYSSATITNCIITDNTAFQGAGIGSAYALSSPTITNNVITKNIATLRGGGIRCLESAPTITNNTIEGNSADFGGGIYCIRSSPTIANTILWNNSPQEIYFEDSFITITHSDIQGGWPGEGNIDCDPLFVDPDNGDYHLQAGSPCIDAGTPEGAPPYDIEGNPRDEFPDMGAYEYQKVGTGSINGTVTDKDTGDAIKWALVIVVLGETKVKAFTDNEGYYEIPNLEPGTYWVLCIKKDYKVGIRKAEVVAGEETTVNFRLRPKPE